MTGKVQEWEKLFINRADCLNLASTREKAFAVLYAPDNGVLIHRKAGWWISNDQRWSDVGVAANTKLAKPTLGPFPSKRKALEAGYTAWAVVIWR